MKEILLYMVDFYDYRSIITKELNNQGWSVHWFTDEIKPNIYQKVIFHFFRCLKEKNFDRYFSNTLKQCNNTCFDLILIIFGGNYMGKRNIQVLHSRYPNVKIVYYGWDSVSNFPRIAELLASADASYTFDRDDAAKYHSNFLPLFYENKMKGDLDVIYDVSTVMSFFIEKAQMLQDVLNALPKQVKKLIYLRVRDRLYYRKIKLLNPKQTAQFKQYFSFGKLSHDEVSKIFSESKVIIDIPLPNQKGLTMRTFEALSLRKKIITTNQDITNYDFYSPDNIFVIKTGREKISMDFFIKPFNETFSLSTKYSISEFIKALTSAANKKEETT